uniref:Uncharacterized protein n=1 Tax=Anopheles coluzzii TaxID=1518534 RepID=A0A8W7PJA8_ANOCL
MNIHTQSSRAGGFEGVAQKSDVRNVSCVTDAAPWPTTLPHPICPALAVDPVPELALPPLLRSSRALPPSIVTLAPLMLTLTTLPPPFVELVPSRQSEQALSLRPPTTSTPAPCHCRFGLSEHRDVMSGEEATESFGDLRDPVVLLFDSDRPI